MILYEISHIPSATRLKGCCMVLVLHRKAINDSLCDGVVYAIILKNEYSFHVRVSLCSDKDNLACTLMQAPHEFPYFL